LSTAAEQPLRAALDGHTLGPVITEIGRQTGITTRGIHVDKSLSRRVSRRSPSRLSFGLKTFLAVLHGRPIGIGKYVRCPS
jgi:hypothetical protein